MIKMTYEQYDELFEIFGRLNTGDHPVTSEDISYPSVEKTEEYLQGPLDTHALHYLLWLSSVLPEPKTEDEKRVHKMISKTLIQNVKLVDSGKSRES